MQVKKQQLEWDMEQQTCSKLGKEYIKAVYCHSAYLTYAEYIVRNAGLDESQAEIKTAWRNSYDLRYADDTTLMTESKEEELQRLLMKLKEEREKKKKNWLKTQHSKNKDHGIRSHHFMANRWGKSGNSDRPYFLGLPNHCKQ